MTRMRQCGTTIDKGFGILILLTCVRLPAGEIHDAIRINDLQTVKLLVERDPNAVFERDSDRVTPLHEAVRYGDADLVTYLLAHGADVKARCYNEFTPLHLTHDPEIARILIQNGADPKSQSAGGTVLYSAVHDENAELINVLLDSGEKLSFEDLVRLGHTDRVAAMLKEQPWLAKAPRKCLHSAAGAGHLEIARLLLDHGADPDLDMGFSNVTGNYSPLSSAVLAGHYEIAKLLFEHGADPNVSGGKMYDNLLHEAVAIRDIQFIQLMLEHGADIDSQKHYGAMTPLHVAASIGDLEKCKLLIRHKADVTARTSDGATPLMFAVAWGYDEVCNLLLTNGGELNIHVASALGKTDEVRTMLEGNPSLANDRDERLRRTPLSWAAVRGHLPLVQLLIQHKADVNARSLPYSDTSNVVTGPEIWDQNEAKNNDAGESALHWAAAEGHTAIVRALIENGALVDAIDTRDRTPLLCAIENGRLDTVKLLLEKGAIDHGDAEFGSMLSVACGNLEITELLLSRNPSPQAVNDALRCAVDEFHGGVEGNSKVVELLLAKGARSDFFTACILGQTDRLAELIEADRSLVNAEQPGYRNERPLILAAEHGHVKVVELLLDNGAEIEPDRETSALVAASFPGQLEVLTLLLDRGADINRKDSMGNTPLHSAAAGGHRAAVELLIDRGAKILARDVYHATALHEAADAGASETARALILAGIPVDCRNEFRETPLHKAARYGHAELAVVLLQATADVNAKNRRGQTPLHYAEEMPGPILLESVPDRSAVVKVLRMHGAEN